MEINDLMDDAEDDKSFLSVYGNTIRIGFTGNDMTLDVFTILPGKRLGEQQINRKVRIVLPLTLSRQLAKIVTEGADRIDEMLEAEEMREVDEEAVGDEK